jgi:capsular polysaccharide biosynthesis protein
MSIGESDELALKVIQALGDKIPPQYREVDTLKGMVELSNEGDLILVNATAVDPALSSEIANAWAQMAVEAINTAYSGEQPLAEIQNQLLSSKQEYETAQSSLEEFIEDNRINLLNNQIVEAKTLFNSLSGDRSWQITYYSDRKQRMENLRVQAEALKLQLQNGSRSQAGELGDALAVLMARAASLGINQGNYQSQTNPMITNPSGNPDSSTVNRAPIVGSEPPGGIALNLQLGEIQTITDNSSSYGSDLEALIQLSEEEIARSDEALKTLEQEVSQGYENESILTAVSIINALETQLEAETARQRELISRRDLTWQAYQAMAQKDTELRNATQTNNQVILASHAIPPKAPLSNAAMRNAVIATAMGLILGTVIVLAVYWWRSVDLNSRAAKPSLSSDPSNR